MGFTESLLSTLHRVFSFNPHSMRHALLCPFYRWESWGTEKLNALSKVIQRIMDGAWIWTPVCLAPQLCSEWRTNREWEEQEVHLLTNAPESYSYLKAILSYPPLAATYSVDSVTSTGPVSHSVSLVSSMGHSGLVSSPVKWQLEAWYAWVWCKQIMTYLKKKSWSFLERRFAGRKNFWLIRERDQSWGCWCNCSLFL